MRRFVLIQEVEGIHTCLKEQPEFCRGFTTNVIRCGTIPTEPNNFMYLSEWTKKNNERMEAICKFLNESNP